MTEQPPDGALVLEHRVPASRAEVFQAWTDVDQLKRWFSPVGMSMAHAALDLRVGGSFHYSLRAVTGAEMWGRWDYLEISAPERIAQIQYFSDASGGVTRHPLAATWPLRTKSTMTLTESDGGTDLAIVWTPMDATPAERATFEGARTLSRAALAGTLEQLTRYLAAR